MFNIIKTSGKELNKKVKSNLLIQKLKFLQSSYKVFDSSLSQTKLRDKAFKDIQELVQINTGFDISFFKDLYSLNNQQLIDELIEIKENYNKIKDKDIKEMLEYKSFDNINKIIMQAGAPDVYFVKEIFLSQIPNQIDLIDDINNFAKEYKEKLPILQDDRFINNKNYPFHNITANQLLVSLDYIMLKHYNISINILRDNLINQGKISPQVKEDNDTVFIKDYIVKFINHRYDNMPKSYKEDISISNLRNFEFVLNLLGHKNPEDDKIKKNEITNYNNSYNSFPYHEDVFSLMYYMILHIKNFNPESKNIDDQYNQLIKTKSKIRKNHPVKQFNNAFNIVNEEIKKAYYKIINIKINNLSKEQDIITLNKIKTFDIQKYNNNYILLIKDLQSIDKEKVLSAKLFYSLTKKI